MKLDNAVSFLVKRLPPGAEPDAPAIAAKLGKPVQAVCNAIDRIARMKAAAIVTAAAAKESALARQAKYARDARAVAKVCAGRIGDPLAAASERPDGSAWVVSDLARAAGFATETVRQAIKRLKAVNRWRWEHGTRCPSVRAKLHERAFREDQVRPTRRRSEGESRRPGTVDLSRCVMLHGVGCLNRVDPRKQEAKT